MISVEQAVATILTYTTPFLTREVELQAALGKVLAENITADRDFPPFDRATMDGIAIRFQDFQQGQRSFEIEAIAAAGKPQCQLKHPNACLEIMTGAILPDGADVIIRYEDVEIKDGKAFVTVPQLTALQHIHLQGEDRKQGDVLLKRGTILGAAEIGIAATVGKSTLMVVATPKALIISSGDELIPIHETPLTYQIRQSNNYAIQAILKSWGIESDTLHLPDDEEVIKTNLAFSLQKYDFLILSGGVSEGKYDFIPKTLSALGVHPHFHKVAQKPGKPLWFGTTATGKVVFALPGNPVSAFLCIYRYVQIWWLAAAGCNQPLQYARLDEAVEFKAPVTYFLQVRLRQDEAGYLTAQPIFGHGSGDLANLLDADAFMELPKDRNRFEAGEVHLIWRYRNLR
ncbi:MAG: molybdopterin molybdotransferase MoeA [Saprospiraceae bacterium]|nr:molybdopterin molybdotransferase MoeA [Saprospiraceae bacterium]